MKSMLLIYDREWGPGRKVSPILRRPDQRRERFPSSTSSQL